MDQDQELPVSVDAERTILGAILLDNGAHAEAAQSLDSDDFSLDSNRRIFLRMTEMIRAGHSVDIVTLAHELGKQKEVEAIGGIAYLASLTEGLPRRPVVGEYARILKDKSLLRRVMRMCSTAINRASDQSLTALEVMDKLMLEIESAEDRALAGADLESVGQWLEKNDIFRERQPGTHTGISEYDALTKGLHAGELTIVAGRTSMGKTSHAGTITWKMAKGGKSVAVFLNEQKKSSFIGRMLCGRAAVSFKSYRFQELDMVERLYIEEAREEFRVLPIFWDTERPMTLSGIRSKAHRLKRSSELDVIVIDQLNGISSEGLNVKGMRGDEIIGRKVQGVKQIGEDLDVPVVLYHQLNRGTLKNDGARPTLADLKGSGEIEEHADNVAFLHRPGYYSRDPLDKGRDLIILAKQRDGETGDAEAEFVPAICRWQDRSTSR